MQEEGILCKKNGVRAVSVQKIWKIALKIVLFVLLLYGLQRVLVPKYTASVIEGNFTEEYYRDSTPHDLLIIGNCESYENISTMQLWKKYGITSYIRGNSNQLIPQSYYLLKESLRYEKPKVVLLNIQAMTIETQSTEEYNRMVFDGMRWSLEKLKGIQATKLQDEYLIEYALPLLRYHSRWSELTKDDLRYAFGDKPIQSYNGYYLRVDIRPYSGFPAERRKADYTFPEKNSQYLERIRKLCEQNEIQLVLMKAPSLYPEWPEPYEEQIEAYAEEHGLLYLNTLETAEAIGIDYETDTYDEGLHLNVYGAEKVSDWLGRILQEAYGLPDHRKDEELCSVYEEKLQSYEAEKERQAEEFAEFGTIRKYQVDTEEF